MGESTGDRYYESEWLDRNNPNVCYWYIGNGLRDILQRDYAHFQYPIGFCLESRPSDDGSTDLLRCKAIYTRND